MLSDGSEAFFAAISKEEFKLKCKESSLEGVIYNTIYKELSNQAIQKEILEEFPKPSIHRRNTGYAVDELLHNEIFTDNEQHFNLCKLLSGSEGTLAFTTEITLQLDVLPPEHSAMVATHYRSLEDCLSDVAPVMNHSLHLCEMMDKTILDCTKSNRQQLDQSFLSFQVILRLF